MISPGSSWFAKTIRTICREKGISLRGLSQDWLWELEKNGVKKRILGTGFDLNTSMASGISRDKVATFELLKANDIPALPHFVARIREGEMVTAPLDWSKGVVVKPLTGQGGKGVRLFYDQRKALTHMTTSDFPWAISPWAPVVTELRIILLDNEVLLYYAKQPVVVEGLKIFKLSKGAKLTRHELTKEEETIARVTQKTLGLRLCAVDLVRLESGELCVLEVNTAITIAPYAAQSADNAMYAKKVYEKLITAMFR